MELRRLKYFLQIAADGSLNGAARSLRIAQPALSRQMQLLESSLGVQLFQRVPNGMRLTEEGDYLREALIHPVQQIEIALQNVRSYSTRAEVACTLGLPPAIAGLLGPGLVRRLAAEMPNLKLTLLEDDPIRIAAELVRGTVDVGILPGVTPDERLFHKEVLSEPLHLVGARDSRLKSMATVSFAALEAFPLILPPAPATLPIALEKLAARTAAHMAIDHEIASLDVTKDLVREGPAFTILPPVCFRDELAAGTLTSAEIIEPELTQSVHVAVQAHWRIARSTYNQFHLLFYDEWMRIVDSGAWPATWLLDRAEISSHAV